MDAQRNKRNLVTKLTLPLFMLSRQRLKQYSGEILKNYIKKNAQLYKPTCEKAPLTSGSTAPKATCQRAGKVLPNVPRARSSMRPRVTKMSHSHTSNMYNISKVPFSSRKGTKTTNWAVRSHKPRALSNAPSSVAKMEKAVCVKVKRPVPLKTYATNKDVRASRSSKHRVVLRICAPSLPGPGHYDITEQKPSNNVNQSNGFDASKAFKFYRGSVVPETDRWLYKQLKNKSFTPGPGYYDTRYVCSCEKRYDRKYEPHIDYLVLQQQISRFRHAPAHKIDRNNFYTYDLDAVQGHGHRRLFKKSEKSVDDAKPMKRAHASTRIAVKLEPDGQYLRMISNPKRVHNYLAKPKAPPAKQDIRFNCIIKPKHRVRLQNVAPFASSLPRFGSLEPPKQKCLTAAELKTIQRLPADRRLTNHPVMRHKRSEMKSQLYELVRTSDSLKAARRRLPVPKILVTAKDFQPEELENGFYFVDREMEEFYRETARRKTSVHLA